MKGRTIIIGGQEDGASGRVTGCGWHKFKRFFNCALLEAPAGFVTRLETLPAGVLPDGAAFAS